ncbi:MAG TPA: GAF domain-containing protein [Longimicrobium sp.]|nr:GAF domain-containing protein [Longimicrobium sp.]
MDHSPALLADDAPEMTGPAPAAVPPAWWPATLETAFAAAGTGVGVLDLALRYRYVNDILAGLNGIPVAAHLGRTVREAIPTWADTAEPLLRRVLETGEATGLELSGLGDGRTFAVSYHPLRVEGQIAGLVGLVADVTESRAAEAALREQEALFSLLMENVPQAFFYVVNPDGPRLRYVSPAYERIFSRSAADLYADPGAWMQAVHPDDRPALAERIGQDRDRATDVEYRVILPDGRVRRVRDRAFPVRDEAGDVRWIAGVGEDVTDAHDAAERQALLALAGDALAASLDADETLRATAELLVPRLADYCMIFTPGADGTFAARVWRHADPALEATTARLAALHRVRGDEPGSLLARAVATGETLLEADVDMDALTTARMGDPERVSLMRTLGPRSVLISGLTARGQRMGVMLLVRSVSGRRYGTEDVAVVRQLAERIGLAVDNARLYGAEHAARAAAEAAVERGRSLLRVAAALNQAATPAEVAAVVVDEGRHVLGAEMGAVAVVDEGAGEFQTLYTAGYGAALEQRYAHFPLHAGGPLARAVLTRQPVFVGSREVMRQAFPANLGQMEESGAQALCTLPLVSGERVLAGLTLGFGAPREFTADDRTFVSILAEQAAQALDRARVYEAEQASRRAAERSARRAEALRRMAAALNGAASRDEVARVIAEDGARALEADAASLAAVDAGQAEFETLAVTGWGAEVAARFARFPLEPGRPTADTVLRREPLFIQSRDEMRARYPAQLDTLEAGGLHAFTALPLFSGDRAVAVVSYSFRAPHTFDADERTFLLTLADQAAQALDRARSYEAERAARAEAEGANRAKTEFLAVMSHELRTPLNAIDGYAELLEMGIRGPVTDAQRSDLGRIRRSQRHLLGLINDVLNFARVEAGHVELVITDVPLAEIVEGLEALVGPQVTERGLVYDCPPADPSLVARADAEKVRQILLNLLSNAVKFTPAGGTVRVTAGAEDGRVRIRVRDTGAGIPADRLESIFEPFVQLDRNLTSAHQGTGLGLAISRDLARVMGGDLAAESVVGAGSVFTLSLPRAETSRE